MICNESYCSKLTFISEDTYNFYNENLDRIIQEGEELFEINNRVLSMNYSFLREDSIFNEEGNSNKGILTKIKEFIISLIKAIKDWLAKIFAPIINIFKKKEKNNASNMNDIKKAEEKISKDKESEVYKNSSSEVNKVVSKIKEEAKYSPELIKYFKEAEEEIKKASKVFVEDQLDYLDSKELNEYVTAIIKNAVKHAKNIQDGLVRLKNINNFLRNDIKLILKDSVIHSKDLESLYNALNFYKENNLLNFKGALNAFTSTLNTFNIILDKRKDDLDSKQLENINKTITVCNKCISLAKQAIQDTTNIYGSLSAITQETRNKLYTIVGKIDSSSKKEIINNFKTNDSYEYRIDDETEKIFKKAFS